MFLLVFATLLLIAATAGGVSFSGDVTTFSSQNAGLIVTKTSLPGGGQQRTTLPSTSLGCSSCTLGYTREIVYGNFHARLAESALLIFTFSPTTSSLHQTLPLDADCTPRYLQPSYLSAERFYVVCETAYQRGTFDPATEQFSLSSLDTPPVIGGNPAISAVIVGGRTPLMGTDDFIIWFFTNEVIFIHAIGHDFTNHRPFPSEGFDCDTLLQLYPIGPKNGDPRIILDCSSVGASRRYELTVDFDISVLASPRTIDTHGTPIVTPGSEYVILYGETSIIIYRTDDYSTRGPKDLGGTIQEIHILERESDSGSRLSLVVTVAEGPQWLIDVADLVDSGGTSGATQLGQSAANCPEGGSCLPVRENSKYLLTFILDGASFKGLIYDLDSPAQPVEEVPNFLERPDVAFFQIEPLPIPSSTAVPTTPTQSSSLPVSTATPHSTSEISQPPPTPTPSSEPLPSSTPSLHTPPVTPSATHPPAIVSSMTSEPPTGSSSSKLEAVVIIIIPITLILMVILFVVVLITVVIWRRRQGRKMTIEPSSWNCWKKPGKSQEEESDRPRTPGEGDGEVTHLPESQQQATDGQPSTMVLVGIDPGYSTGTSSPVSDGRHNPSPSLSGSSLPRSASTPSMDSTSSATELHRQPDGRSVDEEPSAGTSVPVGTETPV